MVNENPELTVARRNTRANIKCINLQGKEESDQNRSIDKVNQSTDVCEEQNVSIGID